MNRNIQRLMLRWINIWPPLLGAGIRVRWHSNRVVDVEMKLRSWNRNYVGTHYGGSLYSMADPFYMLMLIKLLGPDYVVWDKAARIRFRRPGRSTLYARFTIGDDELKAIREALEHECSVDRVYQVDLTDAQGVVHATVEKTVYIRRSHGGTDSSGVG